MRSEAYRAFCQRLIQARLETGLSQTEAAERLGIWQPTLSNMETGERRVDVIELVAIAKLYNKPLSWFVEAEPEGSQ